MISERYSRWVAMLAQSDANLVALALIAVVVVIAWRALSRLPAPWIEGARLAFLVGSAGVLVELATGFKVGR